MTLHELMERMGAEATEDDARAMAEILVERGHDGSSTTNIPEDEWLGMLDAAVNRVAVHSLKSAIERSGLSARRFATEVLIRDERTIRRWLAEDQPIPDVVRRKLAQLLAE